MCCGVLGGACGVRYPLSRVKQPNPKIKARRPSKNALLKAVRGIGDAEVDEAYAKALKALKARNIAAGALIPDDLTETLSPTEVRQMARQILLERGGDSQSKPTQQDNAGAIKELRVTQAEIIYQGAASARETIFTAHLRQLAPLLKAKELAEGRITFARAVSITTGHHGHSKNYKKPSRWIKEFNSRYAKAGKPNPYSGMAAKDYLTLRDFARMHYLNYLFFKLGREQWGEIQRHTEVSAKKCLIPESGQATRHITKKSIKRRT